MAKKTTLLCILDGLGLNPNPKGNAFALANTPVLDRLLETCPNDKLITHGTRVGLPEGQMGNSEVGHLNIGAGRVVEQWLLMISNKLQSDFLDNNQAYLNFRKALNNDKALHIIGLFSDGGVHSHINHLKLMLSKLSDYTGKICLHLITDGRDTSPELALKLVQDLEKEFESSSNIEIASISGRYYAMDRDKRWDRTEKAYQAILLGMANKVDSASDHLAKSYEQGTTDEFIEPAVVNPTKFQEGDSLLFWNFRADRMRQIVSASSLNDFNHFTRIHPLPDKNNVLCFTEYDQSFGLPFIFEQEKIVNHLGEVVSKQGLTQLRVAETEKYPHVTYFFNGLIEEPYPGEDRELLPSPRDVKTYDEKPEMSAIEVTDTCIKAIKSQEYDLLIVNFANCDMVGHTGVLQAAIRAVETVDRCLGEILDKLKQAGGQALIIADHGNAEQMIKYEDGSPHTAHTTYLVPAILYNTKHQIKSNLDASLSDVAPSILELMNIEQPAEMTGQSILT